MALPVERNIARDKQTANKPMWIIKGAGAALEIIMEAFSKEIDVEIYEPKRLYVDLAKQVIQELKEGRVINATELAKQYCEERGFKALKTFANHIEKDTGYTPSEFIREIRLVFTLLLLLQGESPKKASRQGGWSNFSVFEKRFEQRFYISYSDVLDILEDYRQIQREVFLYQIVSLLYDRIAGRRTRPDRLMKQAIDVFGSEEKALMWFKTPLPELGGKTPLEYVDTKPDDAGAVSDVLGRIAHGIFA